MSGSSTTTETLAQPAADGYFWHMAITKNGKEIQISSMIAPPADAADGTAVRLQEAAFGFSIDSPVDDVWKTSDANFLDWSGIANYRVGHSSSLFYHYYIQISARKTFYYYFTDGEGDEYTLSVFDTTHDHLLRYNSDDPNIKRVITG